MDILTQRLIAFGNRVVAELRRLSDAIQYNTQTKHEQQNPKQETQSPPELIAICNAVESIDNQYKTANKTEHRYKGPTFWVSVAGVVVVAAYTTLTYFQWRDANRNFRASQRPWVKIRLLENGSHNLPAESIGKPLVFTLEFSNVGQTPATDVNIASFVEVVDSDKSPNLIEPQIMTPKYPIKGRIFTADVFGFMFQNARPETQDIHRWKILSEGRWAHHTGEDDVLTEDEWHSLKDGNKYVAIWSVAAYRDIFDELHWTAFCTSLIYGGGPGLTRACAEYNNADHN